MDRYEGEKFGRRIVYAGDDEAENRRWAKEMDMVKARRARRGKKDMSWTRRARTARWIKGA